jgi:serine O-acetyltransferase
MISSYKEYKQFLQSDKKALGKTALFPMPVGDEIWIFQRLMRKIEYIQNSKVKIFLPYLYFLKYRYRLMSIRLGFTIPINIFDEGLSIAHIGNIVINNQTRIGKNCRIHIGVNIGEYKGKAPIIGDNVYIAPGVKIFGGIQIGNNIKIGANAVVNKSFLNDGATIVGIPAKEV